MKIEDEYLVVTGNYEGATDINRHIVRVSDIVQITEIRQNKMLTIVFDPACGLPPMIVLGDNVGTICGYATLYDAMRFLCHGTVQ